MNKIGAFVVLAQKQVMIPSTFITWHPHDQLFTAMGAFGYIFRHDAFSSMQISYLSWSGKTFGFVLPVEALKETGISLKTNGRTAPSGSLRFPDQNQ
jgi:hypothetical protein